MTPFQRKLKSLGKAKFLPIKLNNIPERLDEIVLKELVIQLKESKNTNIEIRNRIVEGHIRLGLSIAGRFANKVKFKVEDIIAEMLLCIVESVNRFCSGFSYDNEITPFIISSIHSKLSKFLEEDRVVYMPGRTVRYYTMIGSDKLYKAPTEIYLVEKGSIGIDVDDYEGPEAFKGAYILPETEDDHSESEIFEILDKVTNNFIEEKIIRLRAEGLSYKEIEPLVGYSQASICIMVQNIEKRFDKIYKASS
jgi:DNA-directed RNA polymerase specialized sigma subunit